MNIERNLGRQPIADVMDKHELRPHDVVAASSEQITHKMVSRATKGRRLTPHVMMKIVNALNLAVEEEYSREDLFSYEP